jgi:hypothetical protein
MGMTRAHQPQRHPRFRQSERRFNGSSAVIQSQELGKALRNSEQYTEFVF